MRKYSFISMAVLAVNSVFAQQVPLYSHYDYNPVLYNPAMAGSGSQAHLFLSHRNQWKDMAGAPQSTTLTFDGPLKNKKIGLGVGLTNYTSGFIQSTGITSFYSYRIDLSETSHLNFGLALGVSSHRVDFSQAVVKDLDDPFLLDGAQQKTSLDANAGIMYIIKRTEIGFAIPQLMGNSVEYSSNSSTSAFQLSRSYIVSAKHTFYIDKENNISAYPLLLARFSGNTPLRYDVNAVVNWKEKAWLGIFYQSDFSAGITARVKIHDALSIGYCYNMLGSSLGTSTNASHEIMIGYAFNLPNKKEEDKIIQKQQEEITALSNKLQAVEEALKKSHEAEIKNLKGQITALNQRIEELKKETTDSSAALKLQIQLLQERVELLVKLVGE